MSPAAIPRDGIGVGEDGIARCWWSNGDPEYERYHDTEWGRPIVDDRRLFEKLCLEGFMAGLSWLTILRKRGAFREVFHNFDIETVAAFDESKVAELMLDPRIVRNRAKIEATINNARRCLELVDEKRSLASYVWSYRPANDQRPEVIDWPTLVELGVSREATAMSKDLKRRGWRFVGPTTVYSLMESAGLVNDHVTLCPFRAEVARQQAAVQLP